MQPQLCAIFQTPPACPSPVHTHSKTRKHTAALKARHVGQPQEPLACSLPRGVRHSPAPPSGHHVPFHPGKLSSPRRVLLWSRPPVYSPFTDHHGDTQSPMKPKAVWPSQGKYQGQASLAWTGMRKPEHKSSSSHFTGHYQSDFHHCSPSSQAGRKGNPTQSFHVHPQQ